VHNPDDQNTTDRKKQKFGTADSRHGCAPLDVSHGRALAGERALVSFGAEVKFRATKRLGPTHRQKYFSMFARRRILKSKNWLKCTTAAALVPQAEGRAVTRLRDTPRKF